MSKSLLESAAEIMSASVKGAKKEASAGSNQATDIGGATPTDDYSTKNQSGQGDADTSVGVTTAKGVKQAKKPGQEGVPAEPMKSQKAVVNNPAEVGAQYEETEEDEGETLSEEEIEAYLDSLTEEELAELAEQVEELDENDGMGNSQPQPLNKGSKAPLKKTLPQASSVSNPKMAEEIELTPEQVAEARQASIKKMVQDNMGSCKEDVDALFNGESLSEEFRTKATTIFEAAVRARVEAIAEQVVSENEKALAESYDDLQEEMSTQVDDYLNYVVETWLEENQLAVETGLRAELAEDFINGLKNLFAEHYIEVPEDKADLVEEMAAAVATAEEKLAEQAEVLAATTKALNESKATEILRKTCEGLTEMQVSKIKALAEGVEFTTEGEYTDKLAVIRENYFPTKTLKGEAPQTVVETADEPVVSNDIMSQYVQAITKQLPK